MVQLTDKEQEARSRICLALDVPTVEEGLEMARELTDFVGTVKVNSLFTVAAFEGVDIVRAIYDSGGNAFLDLKFHDTPNTVLNYARAAAVPGVYLFNVHIAGGEKMCKKAVEGAYEGAQAKRIERPSVIGVTVLTSLNDDLKEQSLGIAYDDLVRRRTELARSWGLDGVVCAASKAGALEEEFGSDFTYVTPGIKWAGVQREGQKQLYTPDRAVQDCSSSILVIGGAIAKAGNVYDKNDPKKLLQRGTADDRRNTAYAIVQAMAQHL
ncbi:MAG: orotidine-5'-phosphate decarboxylase [Nanoarchaeota archaeon]|nr:orotidine-5'-phosphate decarboxylase [Nanoarchaeota archaeon]MBU1623246.1 orotidine-5'-phosphate decarboxylase [Nanoarchaeota archaeon]MBU1974449.1 orotidine-5'-phosphate decarboxylase [Nanoarchaeota archaeon]